MPPDADIYEQGRLGAPWRSRWRCMDCCWRRCSCCRRCLASGPDWGNNGSGGDGEAMSAHLVSRIPLPATRCEAGERAGQRQSKGLSNQCLRHRPSRMTARSRSPTGRRTSAKRATTAERQTERPCRRSEMAKERLRRITSALWRGWAGQRAIHSFSEGGAQGGLSFSDGRAFGSRFGWYTDAVARKVHEHGRIRGRSECYSAKRVYILFDIVARGRPRMFGWSNPPASRRWISQQRAPATDRYLWSAAGGLLAGMSQWNSGLITGGRAPLQ